MIEGRPSETALLAARARARHQTIDGGCVFRDPIAVQLVDGVSSGPADKGLRVEGRVARALRGAVVARSRIVEDRLAAEVANGARQYVVLGAGLDTLCLRNPWKGDGLRVFEVDHPDTQAWKLKRLSALGYRTVEGTTFVPADLRSDDWVNSLIGAGFDVRQKAVFSCLGVSIYLEPSAFRRLLGRVRDCAAPGSFLAFDFVRAPQGLDPIQRLLLALLGRRYARLGEPWLGALSRDWISTTARDLLYEMESFDNPSSIARTYFGDAPRIQRPLGGNAFGGVVGLRAMSGLPGGLS